MFTSLCRSLCTIILFAPLNGRLAAAILVPGSLHCDYVGQPASECLTDSQTSTASNLSGSALPTLSGTVSSSIPSNMTPLYTNTTVSSAPFYNHTTQYGSSSSSTSLPFSITSRPSLNSISIWYSMENGTWPAFSCPETTEHSATDSHFYNALCCGNYKANFNAAHSIVANVTSTTCLIDFGRVSQPTECVTQVTPVFATSFTTPSQCWDNCTVNIPYVRLAYWPTRRAIPSVNSSFMASCTINDAPNHFSPDDFNKTNQSISSASWSQVYQSLQNLLTNTSGFPTGNSPSTIVSNGFTFTSPSVYLMFTSIQAGRFGLGAAFQNTGTVIQNTTVAYRPDAISTYNQCGPNPRALDYEDLNFPVPYSVLWKNCENIGGNSKNPCTDPASPANFAQINPRIPIPSNFGDLDSAWSTCVINPFGAFDPPVALARVPDLVSIPNSPADPGITTSDSGNALPPTPLGTLISPTPSATGTVSEISALPSSSTSVNSPQRTLQGSSQQPNGFIQSIISNAFVTTAIPSKTIDPAPHPTTASENIQILGSTFAASIQAQAHPNAVGSAVSDPRESQSRGSQALNTPLQNSAKSLNDPTTYSTSQTPLAVVGTQTVTTLPGGGVGIGSITIRPGDAPTTMNSIPIAVSSSVILVGGSSIALPSVATVTVSPLPLPFINGQRVPSTSNGGVVIAGTTLVQGAKTVIDNTPVSVGANILILGSSTINLPSVGVLTLAPLPSIDGQQIYSNRNGGVVVAGSSIDPGQQMTIAGTPVSVGSGSVVVSSSTFALPSRTSNTPTSLPSIGGQNIQVLDDGSGVVIGVSTIALGQQTTIGGTPVSVGPVNVVIGTSTIPLSQAGGSPVSLPLVGGQVLTTGPKGGLAVGGDTLTPGQQATVSGTPISIGIGNIVIGSSTIPLPHKGSSITLPSVAGQSLIPVPNGGLAIAGTTLTQGQATTISGTPVVIGSNHIVIGSSTFALPAQGSSIILPSVGGQALTLASSGDLAIGGTTLSPGQQTTISGTPISLGIGNAVVGSSTFLLSPTSSSIPPNLVFGGQTLQPGSAITLAGTPVSYGASDLIIGTRTIPIPSSTIQSVFTVAGQTFTANPKAFPIAGTTLSPGGPDLTISGTPVSLGPGGLVIGSSTEQLAYSSVFTIGGQTFTANPIAFSIAGTTISENGPGLTLSGTPISLGANGLVVGTSVQKLAFPSIFTIGGQMYTASLEPGTMTQPSAGIGGVIWSAFNPSIASQINTMSTATTAGLSMGGFGAGTALSAAPTSGTRPGSGTVSNTTRSMTSAQTGAASKLHITWWVSCCTVVCIWFWLYVGGMG